MKIYLRQTRGCSARQCAVEYDDEHILPGENGLRIVRTKIKLQVEMHLGGVQIKVQL